MYEVVHVCVCVLIYLESGFYLLQRDASAPLRL